LHVYSIIDKMAEYKHNWVDYISRMNAARLPKLSLQYKLDGRRYVGWPKKRALHVCLHPIQILLSAC
jgi:hypothetical protein